MIRCVIFDFDGTLVDSNLIKRESFLDIAADLPGGIKVMTNVLDSCVNVTRYEIFDKFVFNMQVPEWQRNAVSEELVEKYRKLCHVKISSAPEIPGSEKALKVLMARGMRLFVSSATPTGPLIALILARGWGGIFQGIYGSPESKPTHIRKILDEGCYSPEELVYVGDSDSDLVAADEAGCEFIGVCIGGDQGRFSTYPAKYVATLDMLPCLIAH